MNKLNTSLSLEQLEKDVWEEMDKFPTGLVEKCFNYRKIPVKNLTVEQLRTLISQDIGLNFLIPVAVERLRDNILTEGDFYPGDLLNAVISCDTDYWKLSPEIFSKVSNLIDLNSEYLKQNISLRQFHRNVETFKTLLK